MGSYQGRRSARECDIGFVIEQARGTGVYVREVAHNSVDLLDVRSQTVVFGGTPTQAIKFLRQRATEGQR